LYAQFNLPFAGRARWLFFELQIFRTAETVKANDFSHIP